MKSVLTIAVGKEIYINMSLNLAKSFLLWNKGNGIEFILVTDRFDLVRNSDILHLITVKEIDTIDYDTGFAIKLYLDKFIITKYTLFIDCDCLVYKDLSKVFAIFSNHSFSAIGEERISGEFFGDIQSIRDQFALDYLPQFVGGLYYLQKSEIVDKIFEFARSIKNDYDKIGLVRLRGKENEEPLLAIGMAKFKQRVSKEDGSIKADMMFYSESKLNILKGKAELRANIDSFNPYNFNLKLSSPYIVHYNASFTEHHVYKAEIYGMKLFSKFGHKAISATIINLFYRLPLVGIDLCKKALRPLYHLIFGLRTIKQSNRI